MEGGKRQKTVSRTKLLVSVVASVAAFLASTPMAHAQPVDSQAAQISLAGSRAEGMEKRVGFRFEYIGFVSEAMRETYDYSISVMGDAVLWGERNMGLGFEFGVIGAEGTPRLVGSDWNVETSRIALVAIPFAVDFLYRFKGTSPSASLVPYLGLGPVLWIGEEKLSATASRFSLGVEEGFEAELTAVGVNFGVQAIVGATVRLGGNLLGVIELRWAQAFTTGGEDLVKDEHKGLVEPALYAVVQRSDFDFSGWRIGLGLRR